MIRHLTTKTFNETTAIAFAHHIWPLLNSGSKLHAFSKDDPIVLLSHNLNYWIPFAHKVCENRLRKKSRVTLENRDYENELRDLQKWRKTMPSNVKADFPLKGGSVWWGEDDAWEATKEMIELADKNGNLRAIMDTIRSNRVEDDFSDIWSNAREDFERKLYHKRSKYKVSFIELDDAPPVHSSTSELHENLLWEDFFVILNKKERQIVVCLKNGITKVGEISNHLGYTNHSPVSKSLSKICEKAKKFLSQS